jgi:hypothetical protein
MSFPVAKRFLLDDPGLSGAVEADDRPPLLHYKHVDANRHRLCGAIPSGLGI